MLNRRFLARAAVVSIAAACAFAAFGSLPLGAQPFAPDLVGGLHWRMLGPFRGGRVDAVSGVPGRPHEFYFGSVNGGVWKTMNAGRTWMPIFDSQPVASIGAIAVAPSSPDIVYVGSGESSLRDSVGYGNGVYKSTDGGKSWTHLGLADTQHIGKVAVDPRNANTVFVAAIGHFYGPHAERGVYRSKDGGSTWQKVLYKNDSTGAIDVAIDPVNSQVVYASLWNTRRPPWYVYGPSNGPGGGIFKSTDGGTTWNQLTNGLPAEGVGRIGLAISPSNPKIVYAVIDAKEGGLFRSNDAGATWTKTTGDTRVWGRGWYFEKVAVDPKNPDVVYVPNVGIQRSTDGGRTFSTWAMRGSPGGDDYQGVWVYPGDGNILIAASDQGAIITLSASAETPQWSSWLNQPTAQIYHVSADYRFPYWVTGAQQDSGAVAVRTRGKFGQISMRDWEPICAGGESGTTAADPLHPGILYGGSVERCDLDLNGNAVNLPPPAGPDGPRRDWTQPLTFSRADPRALYYADQYLYRTTSGSTVWTRISDDLTRPDPGVPQTLDAAAAALTDRNGKRGVIYTIAPSPVLAPMVWIGTDDGLIQVTMNDGKTWQNVTPPALTAWSRVTTVEASHTDFNEAYATVDRHQLEDFDPHIFRTRDSGKTWQPITNGLPGGVYAHVVKEDPRRRGLLFAGTERGIYVSFNDGDAWQPLQLNLPVTSVRDVEIHGDDLIAATHGRGFWVIDDITALRQLDDAARADVFLFEPAEAISVIAGGDNGTPLQKDEPQAENPPVGAHIDYYLKSAASGPVTLEILDGNGQSVRAYSSSDQPVPATPQTVTVLWNRAQEPLSAAAGMHRFVWDLRRAAVEGAGRGRGGRGGGGGRGGAPLSGPGSYTVKLTVNGKSYTRPLTVRADPRDR
ncbi:MAG TPA: hypothetical protein VGJ29_07860 [Vicinamibacterales bacterium]|jgi:photosystem II stability/assembly factor-like uncharacterized protein